MNYQAIAQNSWTSAQAKQWMAACIITRRNVRVSSVSSDTATQLRGAWLMFSFLRQWDTCKARELRKRYGYSRFYELFLQWHRYEMPPADCVEYLESGLSNEAMKMQIIDMHDSREEWERNAVTIYSKVSKLVRVAYRAPEWFTEWARETEELFKRNGVQ